MVKQDPSVEDLERQREALERELERAQAGRRVIALEFRARDLAPLVKKHASLLREAIAEGVREPIPAPTVFVEDRKARAARERAEYLRERERTAQARVDALRETLAHGCSDGHRDERTVTALGVALRDLGDATRARVEAEGHERAFACNVRREHDTPRLTDEAFREGRAVRQVCEARDLPKEVARSIVRAK